MALHRGASSLAPLRLRLTRHTQPLPPRLLCRPERAVLLGAHLSAARLRLKDVQAVTLWTLTLG